MTLQSAFFEKYLRNNNSIFLITFFLLIISATSTFANAEDSDPSILDSGVLTVASEDTSNYLNIGGALRYNLYLEDYGGSIGESDSQFTFDLWRINVEGRAEGININFEYRFYPTFGTHFIKQGWLGYDFSKQTNLQVGVTQVPFGLLQYASHNWWFQLPYYLGLEDDHDMGFKLTTARGNWNFHLAYFMQADPNGVAQFAPQNTARYSYDIVPSQNQSNAETSQFNLRTTYNLQHSSSSNTELGASVQYGGIYNSELDAVSDHFAIAPHIDGTYGNFNIKTEYIYYNHNAKNDASNNTNIVRMAAYGVAPYDVAAEGNMYVLGVSYSKDVDWGPVSNLTFYDNYTYLDKSNETFTDSQHNVLGVMVTAGKVYTYFDIASGKNQPWLTDTFGEGLGAGVIDPRWNTRFNINIGYYF
ncbi:hypothetical protein [Fodinibius sp.]|uniref:hypothetical protein n=1 Tax=Fodinibius sp. TaxID=1872440 RepID=UPI002ACD231F|nr:hypothetical protein [Fodinibius sp.]MDZ7658915.1 hypothetical protein [Fodinibius sp.]